MYVRIESTNEYDRGTGKSMWVNSDIKGLKLLNDSPEHLDSPPWYVHFKGVTYERRGSGDRGGNMISIKRDLSIELTPQDLEQLFVFALDQKLLKLSIAQTER